VAVNGPRTSPVTFLATKPRQCPGVLAFKVGVVEAFAVGWRQTFGSQKRGWLKKILDAIDALLDSLAEVVPGLGSVKEIKESLESLVED